MMKKKAKRANYVVKAKKDVTFRQLMSVSGGGCGRVYLGKAKKDNLILISAAFKRYIPKSLFKIIETVELKEKFSEVCPCCVSETKFFEVDDYPGIVHINQLIEKEEGELRISDIKEADIPVIRGLHMAK